MLFVKNLLFLDGRDRDARTRPRPDRGDVPGRGVHRADARRAAGGRSRHGRRRQEINLDGFKASFGLDSSVESLTYADLQERRRDHPRALRGAPRRERTSRDASAGATRTALRDLHRPRLSGVQHADVARTSPASGTAARTVSAGSPRRRSRSSRTRRRSRRRTSAPRRERTLVLGARERRLERHRVRLVRARGLPRDRRARPRRSPIAGANRFTDDDLVAPARGDGRTVVRCRRASAPSRSWPPSSSAAFVASLPSLRTSAGFDAVAFVGDNGQRPVHERVEEHTNGVVARRDVLRELQRDALVARALRRRLRLQDAGVPVARAVERRKLLRPCTT